MRQRRDGDVLRLKYVDEISADEHARFQPWQVIIQEKGSALDIEAKALQFFVRAPNKAMAALFAYKLWKKWHRDDVGKDEFDRYPEIIDQGLVTVLDEGDYRSVWKKFSAVMKFPKFTGPPKNPLGFKFEKSPLTLLN